ncbi:MAG: zinc ABC transporter substrate-binding protein [Candidatus Omnitrophota bacterium]
MFKKSVALVLMGLVLSPALVCARPDRKGGAVEIVTTLFPTYDFAKQVGGEKVRVSLLLSPGVEAHSYEPKPADIVKIGKAVLFIYTGRLMEPWVDQMLRGVASQNLEVVDASRGIELIRDEGRGELHRHSGQDPHIWLDPTNDQVIVDSIASALAKADPANADYYLINARAYNAKLVDLDRRLKEALSSCKHRTLVYGGHFTFGYFVRRYGLDSVSPYEGFSPNAEPGPRAIAKLIETLKESGMKTFYYEELLDPKVARVIALETGAKPVLLHGAHNISKDELERNVTFLDIMEDNLKKLKIGLECQ